MNHLGTVLRENQSLIFGKFIDFKRTFDSLNREYASSIACSVR
jgi:hypothetical protein